MANYHAQSIKVPGAWGMPEHDPTMLQKVAFTTGHFLMRPGAQIADMGCGWGEGSWQLARLYPDVQVMGIDIDEGRIENAIRKYGELPNLSYEQANIETIHETGMRFDGFLNSSVMHHLYSYNNYQTAYVERSLHSQFEALHDGGILIVRDFLAPAEERSVLLELPHNRISEKPEEMSPADFLVFFSKQARYLKNEMDRGFFLEEVPCKKKGWRRFCLPEKWAREFLLHKDYRKTWNMEFQEEYSFWNQADWARVLGSLGGRVVYHGPFWNRWIVENRFQGRARLMDFKGRDIDFPSTNYIAVVEKNGEGKSHFVGEVRPVAEENTYLTLRSYRHKKTGKIYDMASRPGFVVDVLPFAFKGSDVFVVAKNGYPRPLVNCISHYAPRLDQKIFSGHLIEPVALANVEGEEDIYEGLKDKTGLRENQILFMQDGLTYYPSAGLIDEKVSSRLVQINPDIISKDNWVLHQLDPSISSLTTAGDVRLYKAQELLRAAQVGVLPEARLELNIYALLARYGLDAGPWLDGTPARPEVLSIRAQNLAYLRTLKPQRAFEEEPDHEPDYIKCRRSLFKDAAQEDTLKQCELEFVVPREASSNSVAVIPVAKNKKGQFCLGFQIFDTPARQRQEGDSRTIAAPHLRLPRGVRYFTQAEAFVADKMGCARGQLKRLGEGFYSSIGIMPEKVYPYLFYVNAESKPHDRHFMTFDDFKENLTSLRDAPLMIGGMRALHAFNFLSSPPALANG